MRCTRGVRYNCCLLLWKWTNVAAAAAGKTGFLQEEGVREPYR